MKFIFLIPVIFIVSCARYYYKAPEKLQSHYIENLKDRRISLVSFLEIHYKNLAEDPPEIKVQVFYIIPYIFISAFSLFTIPVIADATNTTSAYHLYDRDMKLLKTFQARLDVIEISAWWAKYLPKFEGECVREGNDLNEDVCPNGMGDIRFFLLRQELSDYLNKETAANTLILKNGKRITGKIHEKGEFYIITDEKGNVEKIPKADVSEFEL